MGKNNNLDVSIELVLNDEEDIMGDIAISSGLASDFAVYVFVDDNHSLFSQLKKRDYILDTIDSELDDLIEIGNLKQYRKLKELINHIDNIYDMVSYILIKFYKKDENKLMVNDDVILDYLKQNPEIRTKKIVIPYGLKITDIDLAKKLIDKYSDYIDNIYIQMEGNNGYVKLLDCYESMKIISDKAEYILKLDLSPLETIMYTYDIVRNRIYKREDENELPSESRNLNSILNGNKIVCLGFANLFYSLLYYMNFNTRVVLLQPSINNASKNGHARNLVYVKDSKYNIDGVYYFDLTADSRRKNETNEFLNRYNAFALTRSKMSQIDKGKYEDINILYYEKDMVKTLKEILSISNFNDINNFDDCINSLNYMSRIVFGSTLIDKIRLLPGVLNYTEDEKKEMIKRLEEIQDKFERPISAETFIRVFNNVRRVEHGQDGTFYSYTLGDVIETVVNSNWTFMEHDEFYEFFKEEIQEKDEYKDISLLFLK